MYGIRFRYGDLGDLVDLLVRSPLTRQAYLPVWFPEDTGSHHGQRVPCTLGYHFMQRGGRLSCRYNIRSCDAYRHLSNDVYFAAALTNWICDEVYGRTMDNEAPVRFRPGALTMHISSLHAFVSDVPKIRARIEES
jgi:thymidylate synthase